MKVFIISSIDILCSNFVQFGRRQIGEIVRCLPHKKTIFLALQLSLYCADRAQILPGLAPNNVLMSAPDFIRIVSIAAEL